MMQALEAKRHQRLRTLVESMKGMLFATKTMWNPETNKFEDSGVPDPKPRAVAFDRIMRLIDTDKAVRRQVVMGDEQHENRTRSTAQVRHRSRVGGLGARPGG